VTDRTGEIFFPWAQKVLDTVEWEDGWARA
jgi:hypothetical protein